MYWELSDGPEDESDSTAHWLTYHEKFNIRLVNSGYRCFS